MPAAERQAPDTQTRGLAEDGVPRRRPEGRLCRAHPGSWWLRPVALRPHLRRTRAASFPTRAQGKACSSCRAPASACKTAEPVSPGRAPGRQGPWGRGRCPLGHLIDAHSRESQRQHHGGSVFLLILQGHPRQRSEPRAGGCAPQGHAGPPEAHCPLSLPRRCSLSLPHHLLRLPLPGHGRELFRPH